MKTRFLWHAKKKKRDITVNLKSTDLMQDEIRIGHNVMGFWKQTARWRRLSIQMCLGSFECLRARLAIAQQGPTAYVVSQIVLLDDFQNIASFRLFHKHFVYHLWKYLIVYAMNNGGLSENLVRKNYFHSSEIKDVTPELSLVLRGRSKKD